MDKFEFSLLRDKMVLEQIISRDIKDPNVIAAMQEVPRHLFVPEAIRSLSYSDSPLKIGSGQTISQPYIVALMTELLRIRPGMKVLEIGTGSGYQAAILAEMGAEVYTIERHENLSFRAEKIIDDCGYGDSVCFLVDDGTNGWQEEAPFDRIIITAAGKSIPDSLKQQLKNGGIMILPLGDYKKTQFLTSVVKVNHTYNITTGVEVRFVPLISEAI